ncbi:MAG: GNAT family N-acetyltransferase [Phycisphaerales bacterium]|nr:GNAT family N-acetyltransferase [Hyphomonadaceae bacterium]
MRLETIHPNELGPAEAARWRAHQRAGTLSPYLTPEWAQIVGAARPDARVCIIEGGEGYFGAQRLSRFSAMGIGAPIADYQGVVGAEGLAVAPAALCRALNVGRIDLSHTPSGQTLFKAAGSEGSWLAETHGGRELYEAALRTRRAEFVRQTDKKARKLERERGHVDFQAQSGERADFETLLSWKNEQLKRSGQPEIWATPWVRETLDRCFEARGASFSGALFTLSADAGLAAAAFCLRSSTVLHFWLVAHDGAFDAYSPGVQLARRIIGWAGDNGVSEVDFGPGDYQYKRQLSTSQRSLEWGVVSSGSVSGALRQGQHALRRQIERLPHKRLAALPGKAMRKLDLVRALAA